MPTYNYYCSHCDTHFSYFQKMSELPISNCENCHSKIQRLITGGTGLIFKGSGFYLTDYKNKKESIGDGSNSDKENSKNSIHDEKKNIENTNSTKKSKKNEKKDE